MNDKPTSKALICQADGTIVELDLATASPEELEMAITDHSTLETVRAMYRNVQDHLVKERQEQRQKAGDALLMESFERGNRDGKNAATLDRPTCEMTFYTPEVLTLDEQERSGFCHMLRVRYLEGFYAGYWLTRSRVGYLSKIILRKDVEGGHGMD